MKKKVYVLVTIDTECDKGNPGWDIARPLAFRNIPLQKELLMPLFNKYGIKPTFLLSPEVIKDEGSVLLFKSLPNVELGTHLHEEFIAPNSNEKTNRTKGIQALLEPDLEKEKLKNLTELFIKNFGYTPKSFRSGRFGSSPYTTKFLADLGYLVDSSVVPYTQKFYQKGYTLNFWGKTTKPYFEKFDNSYILQVPLTLINPKYEKLPNLLQKEYLKPKSKVKKVLNKLNYKPKTSWLRPYRENAEGMIAIADHVINKHFKDDQFSILNIMFHSNEILVNGSPYCKNEEEVNQFIGSLDQLFNHIKKTYKLCSIGLGEVYGIYCQN